VKYPRLIDRVPIPIRPGYESWRTWCMKISDELVDLFPEFQKAALESEALYSAASTVIYQVPSGRVGAIEDLTFFDVLMLSVDLLTPEVYLALSKRGGGPCRYLSGISQKVEAAKSAAKIDFETLGSGLGIDPRELRHWVVCGTHLRPGSRAVVDAWVQVQCPWPIPSELFEYFIGLNREN